MLLKNMHTKCFVLKHKHNLVLEPAAIFNQPQNISYQYPPEKNKIKIKME